MWCTFKKHTFRKSIGKNILLEKVLAKTYKNKMQK